MNFLKRNPKPTQGNRVERNVAKGIHRRRLESTLLQRNFKPLRLLIVDDKRINRDVLSSILSSLNIRSDDAESGREAIQLCMNRKYDIIMMDCMMPDIDGFETASRIRSSSTCINNHTPIIAVSSLDKDIVMTRGKASGMDDALATPPSAEELARIINKWIRLDRSQKPKPPLKDDSPKIVDLEQLTEICQGDIDQVIELANVFSNLLEYEMEQLHEAVSSGFDIKRIRKHASTVSNSAENFCATHLQEAAISVVAACNHGEIEKARIKFTNVARESEKVKTAIRQILN